MFSLNMLDYSMSVLLLSTLIFFRWTSRGTILSKVYFWGFVVGPLLLLKSYRVRWGGEVLG